MMQKFNLPIRNPIVQNNRLAFDHNRACQAANTLENLANPTVEVHFGFFERSDYPPWGVLIVLRCPQHHLGEQNRAFRMVNAKARYSPADGDFELLLYS